VEAAAISKVERAEPADRRSGRQQVGEAPEAALSFLEINGNNILNDIDALVGPFKATATHLGVAISDVAPLGIQDLAVPLQDRRSFSHKPRNGRGLRFVIGIGAPLLGLGLGWFAGSCYWDSDRKDELTSGAAINAVVERIITVESNGNPNEKNSHSSATGLGQFLNTTWLDLIREYRPDLLKGRSETETLELRRETKLAREITTRFVERNAAMLRRRGLPVSAGTIYLAHFAGVAGAVAILSASDSADAALVLAGADATGRTKREQLIKANPFLEHFTVADLKVWADGRMRGVDPHEIEVANAKP
jgi:hypothetical protein